MSINSELLDTTGLSLYRSESYEHPYVHVRKIDQAAWTDSGMRAMSLLIGRPQDEGRILGERQTDVDRIRRICFVNIKYGGDDEYAIGSSHYGADGSETSKLVNRELNKLLKKYARKGVVDAVENYVPNYYWTGGALACGKNWHLFLGRGIRKEGNKFPGYRPAPKTSDK